MPLLLLDLDNTLVDRDTAFRAAVADFLAEHRLPARDLARATGVDAGEVRLAAGGGGCAGRPVRGRGAHRRRSRAPGAGPA